MKLEPYPEYKDSGVPWLEKIPKHWEVKRLKRVAQLNPSKSEAAPILTSNADVTFLPMERVGTDGRVNAREIQPASALWNGFTYFRRADVLVAKITPCFENGKGACLEGLPTEVGFGSTEFIVLRATTTVLPQFLYRTTTLSEFRSIGADAMTGAAGQQRVPPTFVGNFQAALPPLAEQSAIIRFLDYFDHRINRLIRAKRRLIELLNEQKQAIIHRAVTRGLDPNVRFKPSGVEWLGEVPEHWEVLPLKRCANIIDGDRGGEYPNANDFVQSGIPFLSSKCIANGQLALGDVPFITPEKFARLGQGKLRNGDLVITVRGTIGNCALFSGSPYPTAFINAQMMILRPDRAKIVPEYLSCLAISRYWQDQLAFRAYGSAQQQLSNQILSSQLLPVPPGKEQQSILISLQPRIVTVDRSTALAQREIALLREYRTRLIADVVTGKLDVRGVGLPELDEAEVLDSPETSEDIEEIVGEEFDGETLEGTEA